MNKVILFGNLGADPELRFGQGEGSAVLKLRLATTDSYFSKRDNERKEVTDWHSVVIFGKRAEALQKILKKGSTVLVEGRIKTSSYEKDGVKVWKTEINADDIKLAGGGSRKAEEPQDGFGESDDISFPWAVNRAEGFDLR